MRREDAREGTFARAVGPEDRAARAGRDGPVDVAQDPALAALHAYIPEPDCRGLFMHRRCVSFAAMVANVQSPFPRKYVPANLTLNEFADVEPLYRELLDRNIASPAELEKWLSDASELYAVVDEVGNRRYIDKSCHTDDAAIEAAYLKFVEEIEPQ